MEYFDGNILQHKLGARVCGKPVDFSSALAFWCFLSHSTGNGQYKEMENEKMLGGLREVCNS